MKNIFLFGDSIRKGYDLYVKEALSPVANVLYSKENSQNTPYVLRNLHYWKDETGEKHFDAVHFNVGHWDTLRIYGDEPLTRPEVYRDNLCRIAERILFLFPGAKMIFALSTPVIEDGYIKDFECRLNRDVIAYNEIAREALNPYGVVFNDLFTLLADKPYLHSDQSHYYTADATELIGGAVIDCLCRELALDRGKILLPDKEKFTKAAVKGDKELFVKVGDYYEPVKGI